MSALASLHSPARRVLARPARLSGETFATLINLSGRRRFTSQRLVLYTVLASRSDRSMLGTAREALKLFSEAHRALMRGNGELPGVFCEELEDVYFGSEQGDARIRAFIALAERAMRAVELDARDAGALVGELVEHGTLLLVLLNRITQVYEELATRHTQQMKSQLADLMSNIESIAKEARMVALNAQVIAARSGRAGREFSVVAGVLSTITGEIDDLVRQAMAGSTQASSA